jgi:4-amino-4-deoxy-L-arabinose transferase-like glycosyltransferase
MTQLDRLDDLLGRTWDRLARLPWLAAALFLGLQTAFTASCRELWFSDEIRYANAFQNLVGAGKWIVLSLNGQAYPDKPPLYFWVLDLLRLAHPAIDPALFMLGAALSGLVFLLAVQFLARTVGADRDETLAASLILLTNFYFIGLTHYSRMDLLFAALIALSLACLYRAWQAEESIPWSVAGFALSGLATLTKGPLGIVFPLLTSVLFLAWQRRLRRLRSRDVLIGAAALAAIVLAWLAAALLVEGTGFIENIFHKQIYQRAVETWHHPQPVYHYLLTLPLAWLPWTLLPAVANWRALVGSWRDRPLTDCRAHDQGRAFLWIFAGSGFVFLSILSIKIVVYLLPLFAPLAILAARTLLTLDERRKRLLFAAVGVLLLALGLAAAAGEPFYPLPLKGLALAVVVLLGTGHVLFQHRSLGRRSLLLVLLIGLTAFIQPAGTSPRRSTRS